MHKNTWLYAALAVLVLALSGVGMYAYATRPLEGPSVDIEALSTQLANKSASGASLETFTIDPSTATASFSIYELLSGQPKTVIGTTNQVAGSISVDTENPGASFSSEILVSAKDFKTDASARDNAIGRYILQAENPAYEFLRFTPTTISGLPETGTVGQAYPLTIQGELTIKDQTKPTTFEAMATYTAANTLEITAETTIQRGDFNIIVPSVPFVADVAEDVTISLDFTATK